MPLSKRRSHMISFRLSDQEHGTLLKLSAGSGARSLSEWVRWTVRSVLPAGDDLSLAGRIERLQARVGEIDLEVKQLVHQVSAQVRSTTTGQ
jgi:hypothetical protein